MPSGRSTRASTLLLLALLCGCSGPSSFDQSRPLASPCEAGLRPGTQTTLFLGRSIPGSSDVVSDVQLQQFLRDVVSPRIPGFTLLPASGFWKGEPESSMVLLVTHCGERDTVAAIEAVAVGYATTFRQEAVGRTDQAICQTFCSRSG